MYKTHTVICSRIAHGVYYPLQCSGTRPSCERCSARGYNCQYTTGNKRNKRAGSGRTRRQLFSTPERRYYDDDVAAAKASADLETNTLTPDDAQGSSSYFSTSDSLSPEATHSSTDDLVSMVSASGIDPCQRQFSEISQHPSSIPRVSDVESSSVYAPQPLRHTQTISLLSVDRVNDQFSEFSCQINPDPSTSSLSFQPGVSSVEFPTGYPGSYQFHDVQVQRDDYRSVIWHYLCAYCAHLGVLH
jgi:hypothetical protein